LRLTTILGAIGARSAKGSVSRAEVSGISADSRTVKTGELFFAIGGSVADGHEYLEEVRKKGAVGAPLDQFLVEDTREALALAACEFYDHPSEKFPLVGITGTNGKTTVAFLVRSLLASEGINCGLLGTIWNILSQDEVQPSTLTTAQANEIQRLLAIMQENGCRAGVMEVSSHGLDQKRTLGTRFDVAAFTNLTPDHLDYHPDMEHYFKAKSLLFAELGNQGRAVLGWDDPYGQKLASMVKGPKITFGHRDKSDIRILSWKPVDNGSEIRLSVFGRKVGGEVSLIGGFNAENVAAAAAIACALGLSTTRIEQALPAIQPVPGRMELVDAGQPFRVIVDYAHTADALEKALKAAREHTPGRLVSLFGCGGDRYKAKRPAMGKVSIRLADFTVITSDNPRTEDPSAIIQDIVGGVQKTGASKSKDYTVEQDRKTAISKALKLMKEGDTLLIAGKGHEDYQILPTGRVHFDDREVARAALKELGYG